MNQQGRPKVAIIDPNTLAVLGLKQMLQNVMPIMTVCTFGSMSEFLANHPEHFYHYFVAMNVVLENRTFFSERLQKTIVLTLSLDSTSLLSKKLSPEEIPSVRMFLLSTLSFFSHCPTDRSVFSRITAAPRPSRIRITYRINVMKISSTCWYMLSPLPRFLPVLYQISPRFDQPRGKNCAPLFFPSSRAIIARSE